LVTVYDFQGGGFFMCIYAFVIRFATRSIVKGKVISLTTSFMLIILITIFFIKTDYSFSKNETSLTKIGKTDELQLLKENDEQIIPWGVQSLGMKEKK
jgi:hypothetical protein